MYGNPSDGRSCVQHTFVRHGTAAALVLPTYRRQPTLERNGNTAPPTTKTLAEAYTYLYSGMSALPRSGPLLCLQALVNCLVTATGLHEGFSRAVCDATLSAAQTRRPFDLALLVCQIAKLMGLMFPSENALCQVRPHLSRDMEPVDRQLLDALLDGWDGALADRIPLCCPAERSTGLNGEAVYVRSIDVLLFVDDNMGLMWMDRNMIDWSQSTTLPLHWCGGGEGGIVKFGPMPKKMFRRIAGVI